MAHVSHRASSAKKSTSKSPRRTPKSHASGSRPRRKAARPARPTAPSRRPRAASRLDSSTLRGAINKALLALLKRLAGAPTVDGSGTGPAALVRLVLGALVVMLESFDGERQEAHHRAALAFAGAVHAAGSADPGHADGAPPAAAPPSPPSPPPRSDVRRPADPHLRALGIEFHACVDELGQATIADMMALLFVGDDDPTLAIQDSVRRDVRIIRDALGNADGVDMVDTEAIGMALWQIESRLLVSRELHMRMREAEGDERAHRAAAKGGRS
ncbi:hypothetical protein WMF18_17255 [Sorangium sp. So ce315]|uniref:hypothetical protein n=1 Tax=Sorangium sp. So ce315 TaxID=3133299 RepID=UPI003F5E2B96